MSLGPDVICRIPAGWPMPPPTKSRGRDVHSVCDEPVEPAKPANTPSPIRRTFFALGLTIIEPCDTWPSPIITTLMEGAVAWVDRRCGLGRSAKRTGHRGKTRTTLAALTLSPLRTQMIVVPCQASAFPVWAARRTSGRRKPDRNIRGRSMLERCVE